MLFSHEKTNKIKNHLSTITSITSLSFSFSLSASSWNFFEIFTQSTLHAHNAPRRRNELESRLLRLIERAATTGGVHRGTCIMHIILVSQVAATQICLESECRVRERRKRKDTWRVCETKERNKALCVCVCMCVTLYIDVYIKLIKVDECKGRC